MARTQFILRVSGCVAITHTNDNRAVIQRLTEAASTNNNINPCFSFARKKMIENAHIIYAIPYLLSTTDAPCTKFGLTAKKRKREKKQSIHTESRHFFLSSRYWWMCIFLLLWWCQGKRNQLDQTANSTLHESHSGSVATEFSNIQKHSHIRFTSLKFRWIRAEKWNYIGHGVIRGCRETPVSWARTHQAAKCCDGG